MHPKNCSDALLLNYHIFNPYMLLFLLTFTKCLKLTSVPLTSAVHGQAEQLSPLLPFSPSPPKNRNCKDKYHLINHVTHIRFQSCGDLLMVLTQAKCSGFGAAVFMTNAVQGLSAV